MLFNWFDTARHLVAYYNPLPVSDYWRVVEDLPAIRHLDLRFLWHQHNEHRIVFPEIVFAADMLLFQGREVLPAALNAVFYLILSLLVTRVLWKQKHASREVRLAAIGLFGILTGWPVCTFVVGVPFLLLWSMLELAIVLALMLLARTCEAESWTNLAAIAGCGIVATFSSANGMLLWVVLWGAALILRRSRRTVVSLAAAGILSIGLFFVDYRVVSHIQAFEMARHPLLFTGFVLSYLSMPFGVIRSPVVGLVFGSLNALLWLLAIANWRHLAAKSRSFACIALGYFAFTVLTAAVTAAGRLDNSDAGFGAAKAGRYVTGPLLNWALLLATLVILSAWPRQWQGLRWKHLAMASMAVILFMQIRLLRWQRTNDRAVTAQQLASLSLESGLVESRLLQPVFPDTSFVEAQLPLLRSSHRAVFAGEPYTPLGKNVNPILKSNRANPCLRLESVDSMHTGAEIRGGITGACRVANGTDLYLINSQNLIGGFGKVISSRSWVAFLSSQYETPQIRIAWRDSHGQMSRLASVAIPRLEHAVGPARPE